MLEKQIDVDKISQKTHISVLNINHLLNLEFDKLNALKTNSFIAIIEREMQMDLSEIRESSQAYYKTQKSTPSVLIKEYDEINNTSNKLKYIIIVILLLSSAYGLFLISKDMTFNNDNITIKTIEDEIINKPAKEIVKIEEVLKVEEVEKLEDVEEEKLSPLTEEEITQDTTEAVEHDKQDVEDQIKEEIATEPIEQVIVEIEKSIKVVSKQKVWIGVTYLDDLKFDNFTKKEFAFDATRDFVAVFGHNYIKIITHDNEYDYKNEQSKRRISYIDGEVSIITKKSLENILKEVRLNR
ncbi:MAG: hypothetical protein U9N30_00580 [Campylobacterota bacterium]|nr:hypothetical protein [Campylobacterota bacterium]